MSEQPIKIVRPITVRATTVLQPGPILRVTNDPGQAIRRPTTAVTHRGARTPGRAPGVLTPGLRKTIQEIPTPGLRHPAAPRARTAGLPGRAIPTAGLPVQAAPIAGRPLRATATAGRREATVLPRDHRRPELQCPLKIDVHSLEVIRQQRR